MAKLSVLQTQIFSSFSTASSSASLKVTPRLAAKLYQHCKGSNSNNSSNTSTGISRSATTFAITSFILNFIFFRIITIVIIFVVFVIVSATTATVTGSAAVTVTIFFNTYAILYHQYHQQQKQQKQLQQYHQQHYHYYYYYTYKQQYHHYQQSTVSSQQQQQQQKQQPQHRYLLTIMGSCFGRCISKEPHAVTTSCLWRNATDEQDAELISNASEKYKRDNFIYRIIKFKAKQKRPQFIDKFLEHQDLHYTQLTNKNGGDNISDIQLQNLDVQNLLSSSTLAKESALNYAVIRSQNGIPASSRASSSLDLEWEHEYAHMRHYTPTHALGDHQNINNNNHILTNSPDNPKDSWQYLTSDDLETNSQASSLQSLPQPVAVQAANAASTTAAGMRRLTQQRQAAATQLGSSRQNFNNARSGSFTRTSSHNSWSHISTPESLEWDIDEDQQRQLRVEDDNLDHETLQLLHQIEQLKNQVLNETGEGLYEERDGIEFIVNSKHAQCDETIADFTDIS